nr:MAG TPA: hypothetical protein [Caudoviricetes sp.]
MTVCSRAVLALIFHSKGFAAYPIIRLSNRRGTQ